MNLSQFLATVFTAVKNGLITALVPDLLTFFQNTSKLDLASVSGLAQYVAQLDLLRSSAVAALTAGAPAALQELNQTFSNEIEAALQKLLTAAQASAAPAAAAAKA